MIWKYCRIRCFAMHIKSCFEKLRSLQKAQIVCTKARKEGVVMKDMLNIQQSINQSIMKRKSKNNYWDLFNHRPYFFSSSQVTSTLREKSANGFLFEVWVQCNLAQAHLWDCLGSSSRRKCLVKFWL